ncbi:26S proteasome non-ATPase regulatory subunit 9 [Ostrinia furnacalis]|uniref:26S proteasome non-ATPase regulatory subunit 9 n=1 Tax=Ostrinia furnacalis TaxID=93504 RepID=UPI00103ACE3D|nr:26S proteasome non-ATPase regulatory subunit 9 [Ostrinia furnacalis]
MVGYSMNGPARDRVIKLMEDKDRIETEIREQTAVLASNNVGMSDPLVDADGFPRADIDVYKVRHARHRIICLQNDHKSIMRRIEQGLAEVHSDYVGPNGEGPSVVAPSSSAPYANGHSNGHSNGYANGHGNGHRNGDNNLDDACFAVVGEVQDGSPAYVAGLREHDEILQFGSINSDNYADILQVSHLVTHSVGQNIHVQIRRGQQILDIDLVPRQWSRPGLLGCHIRRRNT